jgi:septal ring factor EnvC (AmiA/AmiB activator)
VEANHSRWEWRAIFYLCTFVLAQDLTAKARQLQLTSAELQQLKEDHSSLQARMAALSQQLVATSSSLREVQAAQQQAAAEALQLGERLEQSEQEKAQLMRQVGCWLWTMCQDLAADPASLQWQLAASDRHECCAHTVTVKVCIPLQAVPKTMQHSVTKHVYSCNYALCC